MSLPDGVYFDMPEEIYHALPRFSASGVKQMMISPLDFWVESWMNPDKQAEREAGEDSSDSMFKIKGRAYHCRLLEGVEAFASRYAYGLDPETAFEGKKVLITSDDISGELKAMGVAGLSKLRKAELAELLLAHDPSAIILERELEKHVALNPGKTIIPHQWRTTIEFGAAMIERNPVLSEAMKGGFAEVAILWTQEVEDPDGSGMKFKVPMKMKADKLKPGAIIDYKSFGNQRGAPIAQAVINAMAERKNHIQVAIYYEGADRLGEFIAKQQVWQWRNDRPEEACIYPEIEALAKPDKKFFFIFQQSGKAPVAVGRIMDRGLNTTQIGKIEFDLCLAMFAKCAAHYGTAPWVEPVAVQTFEDDQFPIYMTQYLR